MGDPLINPIMTIHNILIICVIYIIVFNTFYLIFFLIDFLRLYIFTDFFNHLWYVIYPLYFILCVLNVIAYYTSLIILVMLFWVFVFWMLILIFVPFIIIFPIPIPPFIFILPLKPLMLLLIPPFKTLTDLGALQLVFRIFSRIFTRGFYDDFLNSFIKPSYNDINNYLYENFKQLAKDYGNNSDITNFYSREKIDDDANNNLNEISKDNPDDVKKYDEYKEKSNIKKGMNLISYETDMCIKMKQKFKPYNSSYMNDVNVDMDNSFSPYNECYSKAIKSYLKTSIG